MRIIKYKHYSIKVKSTLAAKQLFGVDVFNAYGDNDGDMTLILVWQ